MSDARGGFWSKAGQIGCGIVVVLIVIGAVAAAFLGGRSNPLSSKTRFDEMQERPATKEERSDDADVRKRLADLERRVEALEKK